MSNELTITSPRHPPRMRLIQGVLPGVNGGKRPGAGRKKGSVDKPNSTRRKKKEEKLVAQSMAVDALAREWTTESIGALAELAFGKRSKEDKVNLNKMAIDTWLRLACIKMLLDRGWGKVRNEIKIEANQIVSITKYSRECLATLTLEQISALWREQVAAPAGLANEPASAVDRT